MTARAYDRLTFELKRLRTTAQDGRVVQDLNYTYDPVGNISSISDSAQQAIFFRNIVVSASNDYTYDGLYRLVSASGREHLGQHTGPPSAVDPDPVSMADQANNGQAMGLYTETYKYDLIGNLLSLRHASSDSRTPGWTRTDADIRVQRGQRRQRARRAWGADEPLEPDDGRVRHGDVRI